MSYDAREIANFFLDYADEKKRPLTIITLLKLIYFAHGWYLVHREAPLIKNGFEAWQYGPVVRVVYDQFQSAGNSPITERGFKFDPVRQVKYEVEPNLNAECQVFLINIFDAYSQFYAFDLSDMTHETGSPWDRVWNNIDGKVTPGMKISDQEIKQHFLSMANRKSKN